MRTNLPCDPGKRWLTFLQNHREVLVAFDFFTVPTETFKVPNERRQKGCHQLPEATSRMW